MHNIRVRECQMEAKGYGMRATKLAVNLISRRHIGKCMLRTVNFVVRSNGTGNSIFALR